MVSRLLLDVVEGGRDGVQLFGRHARVRCKVVDDWEVRPDKFIHDRGAIPIDETDTCQGLRAAFYFAHLAVHSQDFPPS